MNSKNPLRLDVITTAATPPSGTIALYMTSAGLCAKDSAGTVVVLSDLFADTTPQLNGELDMNGHTIGGDFYNNGNSGTSKNIDWRLGNHQMVTLTGNCTFTFTAPTKAGALSLYMINDGTAGRTRTFPSIGWDGGVPAWVTTANAINHLSLIYTGTVYIGGGMKGITWA